jgi:hypothetical protein
LKDYSPRGDAYFLSATFFFVSKIVIRDIHFFHTKVLHYCCHLPGFLKKVCLLICQNLQLHVRKIRMRVAAVLRIPHLSRTMGIREAAHGNNVLQHPAMP